MRSFPVFLAAFLLLSGCSLVMDTSPADPAYTPITGDGGAVSCNSDDDCDDHAPCNGVESCGANGFCVAGEPVVCPGSGCKVGTCQDDGSCIVVRTESVCDDGVDCTIDACGDDGTCSHALDDDVCDDGVACTKDLCLGVAVGTLRSGCYSVPQDNLCTQPLGVANPCASYVCAPAATDEASGCTLAPLDTCDPGKRCNLDTLQCEQLAGRTCDACNDGNDCNGVESCSMFGTTPACTSAPAPSCQLTTDDACKRVVCNELATDAADACLVVRAYTAMCLLPVIGTGP